MDSKKEMYDSTKYPDTHLYGQGKFELPRLNQG